MLQFPSKNNDWLEEEMFDDEPWDSSNCCDTSFFDQPRTVDEVFGHCVQAAHKINVASGEDVCLDAY